MNVGSLFSGVGGIDLGFEQAGFSTAWFVEREPFAQAILRKRFPDTIIYDDVTKIDFGAVPKVDVLNGGFPCQDISNAGKRAGIEGSRSSLWKYYLEAIRTIRPKYALIENVSALSSRGLDVVLADLASIGYDAEWHCVSASSVGAPHRRDRIFIISYPNSDGFNIRIGEQKTEGHEYREGGEALSHLKSNGESFTNVSNSCSKRLEGQCKSLRIQSSHSNYGINSWWSVEPRICRVADGVPNRVDRIRCLGNAVVPQLAEVFAKAIKEVGGD